jgi:hypothetical protein
MKIINKTYNIISKLNKKIVLISDLHYNNKKDIERLNYILNEIENIKPNYICIPGDIINKSTIDDEELFIYWLKELSKICKVIISIGNHEFYIDKHNKIFGLNKEFLNKISNINNIYLLDNKNIIIDNINFIGITLPIEVYLNNNINIDKYLNKIKIDKKYYNILLCHSPINICKNNVLKDRNIDLVLCGHMHGGIIPNFLRFIFKTRGLVSPNKTLFPKNAYGYLKKNNTHIIITSGTKVLPNNKLSIIFKPEIVTINLI